MVLLASNKAAPDQPFEGEYNMVPYLVSNGAVTYLLDLHHSMQEETTQEHESAKKASINISQALAIIFSITNPVLIFD